MMVMGYCTGRMKVTTFFLRPVAVTMNNGPERENNEWRPQGLVAASTSSFILET